MENTTTDSQNDAKIEKAEQDIMLRSRLVTIAKSVRSVVAKRVMDNEATYEEILVANDSLEFQRKQLKSAQSRYAELTKTEEPSLDLSTATEGTPSTEDKGRRGRVGNVATADSESK